MIRYISIVALWLLGGMFVFVGINKLSDLSYRILDPRAR